MKLARTFIALTLVFLCLPAMAQTQDNSTPGIARPVQEQAAKPAQDQTAAPDSPVPAASEGRFPLDIQSRGTDQSGTLLSYKLKEEVIASRLFDLKVSDKKDRKSVV